MLDAPIIIEYNKGNLLKNSFNLWLSNPVSEVSKKTDEPGFTQGTLGNMP
jgi:hypothetical protein